MLPRAIPTWQNHESRILGNHIMSQSRLMKSLLARAAIATFAAFVGVSCASNCYIIYDRNDQTIYRGLSSPIDLSQTISEQINSRWAGSALVIVGEAAKCIPFDTLASYSPGLVDSVSAKAAGKTASPAKKRTSAKKRVRAKRRE
jgi:hypothetical protein